MVQQWYKTMVSVFDPQVMPQLFVVESQKKVNWMISNGKVREK